MKHRAKAMSIRPVQIQNVVEYPYLLLIASPTLGPMAWPKAWARENMVTPLPYLSSGRDSQTMAMDRGAEHPTPTP